MMKICKLLCLILVFSFLFYTFVIPINAQETAQMPLSLSAQSAILMEAESGTVVCEKNAHTRLPMASTTKIMTALVALELAAPDTVIAVDGRAVGTEGSSIYLCKGETLTLEELLYALMLESANDAAVAIAIGICGSVEAFANAMNAKASRLGLSNTHFSNPHGLDADEHYTTAYDLACIAKEALKIPLFKTIVSTRKITIPHQNTDGVRLLINHNKMLRQYDGCIGVKTGYTQKSGRCLVSAAERDGVTMIAVTLHSPDDWSDHTKLLDYGFANYRAVALCPADYQFCLPVVGGKEPYVVLGVEQALSVALPVGAGVIEQTVECQRFAFAPINVGDECAYMLFYCDTNNDGTAELIQKVPLVARYHVPKNTTRISLWQRLLLWWRGLFD